jgi:glycosylphosphatidylinositol deacylase
MIRRLSGSEEAIDNAGSIEAEPPPYRGHGSKKSFTSAKYDVTRHSDSLDRRKVEKVIAIPQASSNGPNTPAEYTQGGPKKQTLLLSREDVDRMAESRFWRRSRARSPWRSSLLTISITALALVLLLSIVHAFLTRQLDPKGCDMCWSRPIYLKFSDFDTEHTRFATKYSLHLLREGGFDEDPKVGAPRHKPPLKPS